MTRQRSPQIGLEVSSLATPHRSGVQRYMQELALALAEAAPAYDWSLWYRLSRLRERRHWWRPSGFGVRTWQAGIWPPLPRAELIHGLDGAVPGRRGVKTVVTFHDFAVFRDGGQALARDSFRRRKLARYRDAARRADAVVAVSRVTARDAARVLDLDEARIRVVPHGVAGRFRPLPNADVRPALARYGLTPGYLLHVGAPSARKNTHRLVQAFARSGAASELKLVLAGRRYHREHDTLATIESLRLEDRVAMPGYIHDRDIPALYAGARGFVFPTLYEGFGLPILEAMATGVPVLCGERGAAPDTAGGLAIAVDPESVDAIAAGIDELLSHPVDRQALIRHARQFTWDNAAHQTLAVYRELLNLETDGRQ